MAHDTKAESTNGGAAVAHGPCEFPVTGNVHEHRGALPEVPDEVPRCLPCALPGRKQPDRQHIGTVRLGARCAEHAAFAPLDGKARRVEDRSSGFPCERQFVDREVDMEDDLKDERRACSPCGLRRRGSREYKCQPHRRKRDARHHRPPLEAEDDVCGVGAAGVYGGLRTCWLDFLRIFPWRTALRYLARNPAYA